MAARISWSIYWANSKDGTLGTAMIGQFTNGRGEFYDQELFQGRAIYVRFIFSDITPTSFRLEQAFFRRRGNDLAAELDRRVHAPETVSTARAAAPAQRPAS